MSALLAAIVHFVERTAAIARTGLAFNPQGFDAERYEELDDLSFDDLGEDWDDELVDADHEAVRELDDLVDNDLVVDQGLDEDDEEP